MKTVDLSANVLCTILTENIYSITLVQQCQWLEGKLKCEQVLKRCLSDLENAQSLVRCSMKAIYQQDWIDTIQSAAKHPSLKHIICSDFISSSCCCIWDLTLDKGESGTRLAQCLFKSLCRPLMSTLQQQNLFWRHLLWTPMRAAYCTLSKNSDDEISLAMQILNL